MKIINIEQGDDAWHVERHRCVTGTRLESALGACFSTARGTWLLNGHEWIIDKTGAKRIGVNEPVLTITDEMTEKQQQAATKKHTAALEKLIAAHGKKIGQCEAKQYTLMLEMISERQSILEIDDYCSADMERGNTLEPFSVEAASEKIGCKLDVCGMLQSDTEPRFKFSPDAVYYDKNGVVTGGYETKSKAGKKHIEYLIAGEIPTEHIWQCLGPMIMDDCVKWWLFGSFDDRNHINPLFTVGIKSTEFAELIKEARLVLAKFFTDLDSLVAELGGDYDDY